MPPYVRVSLGTLASLGLLSVKMAEKPRTAYLLQYSPIGCRASCGFCMQSKKLFEVKGREYLGRIPWPVVDLDDLANAWKGLFERICFQTVIKPGFAGEMLEVLKRIRSFEDKLSLSLAVTPVSTLLLREVKSLGVDVLGVGLDAASPGVFENWGKPYSWSTYLKFIEKAVQVFGRGNVYVHVVVGLGETLTEVINVIKKSHEIGARVALFNYVDERGKSPVDIGYYRLVQIARFLVENGLNPDDYIDYSRRRVSKEMPLEVTRAFYTSGCPSCNRPFYNEKPSGPLYNVPSEKSLKLYMDKLRAELAEIGVLL